jgi:hypothetical protein
MTQPIAYLQCWEREMKFHLRRETLEDKAAANPLSVGETILPADSKA